MQGSTSLQNRPSPTPRSLLSGHLEPTSECEGLSREPGVGTGSLAVPGTFFLCRRGCTSPPPTRKEGAIRPGGGGGGHTRCWGPRGPITQTSGQHTSAPVHHVQDKAQAAPGQTPRPPQNAHLPVRALCRPINISTNGPPSPVTNRQDRGHKETPGPTPSAGGPPSARGSHTKPRYENQVWGHPGRSRRWLCLHPSHQDSRSHRGPPTPPSAKAEPHGGGGGKKARMPRGERAS